MASMDRMSGGDFYQILGVGPSASAREIKSAYRRLVKRYHPDLFSTAAAKADATEKLRQINEAYAVLGNPKRRHDYDQCFNQRPAQSAPVAATAPPGERRGASPRRPAANRRDKTQVIKFLKARLRLSKKQVAYALVAAVVVALAMYANRSVPRVIVMYSLLEKVEVSPPESASASAEASPNWVTIGRYATVAECAGILKERVRKDEQEGSRAAFGEPNGTMAITVLIRSANTKARENPQAAADLDQSPAIDGLLPLQQKSRAEGPESLQNGMTKRIRNLECRAVRQVESESWLQKAWRGAAPRS
jgi:hypothetical protein